MTAGDRPVKHGRSAVDTSGGRKDDDPMTSCPGQLVVHRDGSVASCSEHRAGRSCAGEDLPHRRGFLACRIVEHGACTYCELVVARDAS